MERARQTTERLEKQFKRLQREGLDRVSAGMTIASDRWANGLRNLEMQQASTVISTARLAGAAEHGVVGFRRFETAVMGLGLEVVGVHGKVARMAEFLLTLGVGGTVALALTGGLAVVGAVWDKVSEKTRKAAEETKKFVEEQLKAARLRADPNADILSGREATSARATELRRQITELEGTRRGLIQNFSIPGLGGMENMATLQAVTTALGKLRTELEPLEKAVTASSGAMAVKGQELVRTLALQAATFGMSEEAAQRYAISMDGSLSPAIRKSATALLTQIQHLRETKEAQDAAKKAAEQLAAETEAFWLSIDRVANLAGPKMVARLKELEKAQKDALGDSIMAGFEQAKGRTWQIKSPEAFDKMLADAKLWQETWRNAVEGVQEAFAQMFEDIGKDGFRLVSLLENIARAVQRSLAQLAAQQITNWIFSGLFKGGLPAAPDLGNLSDNPIPSLSNPSRMSHVVVNQSISFNAGFVDGVTGAAWLKSQSGTIAGVVAQAASDAPAFARHLVAAGSR